MSRPVPRHRAEGRSPGLRLGELPLGRAAVALPLAATLTLSGMAVSSAAWVSTGAGSTSATAGTLVASAGVIAASDGPADATVDVSWSPVTGATRYELYRSGTTVPIATVAGTTYADTLGADGTYTYRVVARTGTNWIGPASAPSGSVTYVAAPGAPVISSSAPDSGTAGDGFTNVSSQTLSGTAKPGSSVTITQNGTVLSPPVTATSAGTFTASVTLSAGANTFTARAENAGGGSAPSASFVVSLDQVNPVTTYNTATKKLEVVESGSGLAITYVKIDGGPFVRYEQQQITVASGTTLSFYSEDAAGNKEPVQTYTPAPAGDITRPSEVSTDPSPDGTVYRTSSTVVLSATDNVAVTSFTYTLNGVTRTVTVSNPGPSATASITLPEGTNTLSDVYASDAASNKSATLSGGTFKIDTVAPDAVTFVRTPISGTHVRTVTLSSSDAGSGVVRFEYLDNGVPRSVVASPVDGSFTATLDGLSDGVHLLTGVVAIDGVDRRSTAASATVTVDRTAPITTATQTNGGNYVLSVVETGSGGVVTYCSKTSSQTGFSPCGNFTLGNRETAWFYSVDRVGNVEVTRSVTRGSP